MPSDLPRRTARETSSTEQPLRVVVSDEGSEDMFSVIQNSDENRATFREKPTRHQPPCKKDARGCQPLPLDNLYTLYDESRFDLDLPDPGNHRPWYHLNWSSPVSLRRNQHRLTRSQR